MSYRDESEALRARIDVLENELADAKKRIADLSGETKLAPPSGANSFWVSAPTKLLLERELDLEPTPEIIDRLTTAFRREYPMGTITPSERTFGFRLGTLDVSLMPIGGGRARLRLYVDHTAFAMLPMTLAGLMGFVAMAPIGATLGPLAILVILPIAIGLAFLFLRKMWGVRVHGYRAKLTKLFEMASAIAIAKPAPVRVATPTDVSIVEELDAQEEEANERQRRI